MYVGLPWAHARAGRLAAGAAARLADTPGVELVTPPGRMAALVTFRLPGWHAERVAEELARRVFASVGIVAAHDAIRISVGFFTGEEELGRFMGAVAEIARHTPASLPRRPVIEFLGQPPT
jgi:selenocysteine lyase/cysteine desulfurase